MDSTHLIYNITKECLFDKYNNNNDLVIDCQNNNIDKKFYRKRIINLFKLLFLNQEEQKENDNLNNLPIDIKQTFDVFNLYCIDYFKTIDTNEQINKLNNNNNNNNNENNIINKVDNINEYNNNIDNDNELNKYNKMLMINNPTKSKSSLDNFVVINKNKNLNSNNELHIPQQKNINLYDPILKNKKLNNSKNTKNTKQDDIFLQKKNVDINYEEDDQNKKSKKTKNQKKTNIKNKKNANKNEKNANKKELQP
jgi:hypothetical protein